MFIYLFSVVKTEDMHQKLIQVNTHQKCIIANHQTDILKYRKEIMSKTALLKELEKRMEPKDNQDNDNKHNDTQMKEMVSLDQCCSVTRNWLLVADPLD